MITSTWQNTANIKANASKSNITLVVVGAVCRRDFFAWYNDNNNY
jgi:hypothetical protein